jgi:hypothetical protein
MVSDMALTDRPLTSEERAEITRQMGIGLKKIGADRAVAPSQDKLQELIGQSVESYRKLDRKLSDGTVQTMSKSLGCLWGQVLCDELGWTWTLIKDEKGLANFGVVTPNRSHVVYPLQFIHDLLCGKSAETGSTPLYRRIRAGQIPDSQARAYLAL